MDVVEYTEALLNTGSTSIKRVFYNENTLVMTIEFVSGGVYSYEDVTPGLYKQFIGADSLGIFYGNTFREQGWNGTRHNSPRFRSVAVQTTEVEAPELAQANAKPLNFGGDSEFEIVFTYSGKAKAKVTSQNYEQAIKGLVNHYAGKGMMIKPESVTINLL